MTVLANIESQLRDLLKPATKDAGGPLTRIISHYILTPGDIVDVLSTYQESGNVGILSVATSGSFGETRPSGRVQRIDATYTCTFAAVDNDPDDPVDRRRRISDVHDTILSRCLFEEFTPRNLIEGWEFFPPVFQGFQLIEVADPPMSALLYTFNVRVLSTARATV